MFWDRDDAPRPPLYLLGSVELDGQRKPMAVPQPSLLETIALLVWHVLLFAGLLLSIGFFLWTASPTAFGGH